MIATPIAHHPSPITSKWVEEAQRYLVGGVNSPVRAFRAIGREPILIKSGRGALITATSRRTFIDCIMGWGALILGHAHPTVLRAVRRQLSRGAHFGLTTEAEIHLAKMICEAMASIEQVRFTPSGTEACMTAIRLARACTGRSTVLIFEGCYHGHSVPDMIAQETLTVPYDDLEALEEAFARDGRRLACAIVEPVAANMGLVVPDPAFLKRLRALTQQHRSLLIFDEVVTGFRVAYGGAQARVGIRPDLTVLGKIIGGGFPIGAIGGPQHLMQQLAPEGQVYHAGTFAGHPIAMVAGLATLQELKRQAPYERLEALGAELADGWREAARRHGLAMQVTHLGSMLTAFFTDKGRFARFANGLLDRGMLIPPSPVEAMFLSTAHTRDHVEQMVRAASKVFAGMQGAG